MVSGIYSRVSLFLSHFLLLWQGRYKRGGKMVSISKYHIDQRLVKVKEKIMPKDDTSFSILEITFCFAAGLYYFSSFAEQTAFL